MAEQTQDSSPPYFQVPATHGQAREDSDWEESTYRTNTNTAPSHGMTLELSWIRNERLKLLKLFTQKIKPQSGSVE